MRLAALFAVLALPSITFAEPHRSPAERPAAKAPAPDPCPGGTMKKVGKKNVCEATATIKVTATADKPAVAIVPTDGRKVVGRPKSDDRLQGLSPRLR